MRFFGIVLKPEAISDGMTRVATPQMYSGRKIEIQPVLDMSIF